ncbi:hypothetical protein QTP88_005235 [Uroleucon formosanum]
MDMDSIFILIARHFCYNCICCTKHDVERRSVVSLFSDFTREIYSTSYSVKELENYVAYLMKNKALYSGIQRSPYKAMFGTDIRVGLTTRFPSDSVDNINTEDDLEIFLNNINEEDENEGVDEKNNVQVVNENYCSKTSKDDVLCDLICSRQKLIENNRKNLKFVY